MNDVIKSTISLYIKRNVDDIDDTTIIDRSVVGNSILIHRMYAKLASEGVEIRDYFDIKTFGELRAKIEGTITVGGANVTSSPVVLDTEESGVGIDIELIDNLPVSNDYREDAFYKQNFSASEISYCLLQTNPVSSFAGLFAAKEAVVKSHSAYRRSKFCDLVIGHDASGKPLLAGFDLSISHIDRFAIAVAVHAKQPAPSSDIDPLDIVKIRAELQGYRQKSRIYAVVSIVSFLISVTVILFVLFK